MTPRRSEGATVALGTVTPAEVAESPVTRRYFVEAPDTPGDTGRYTFGPAMAIATIDGTEVTDRTAPTDTDVVVGASTEPG